MRIDAHQGDSGWSVWDCRHCCDVPYCVWVDDSSASYGAWGTEAEFKAAVLLAPYVKPLPPVHQAERIAIITTSRLVLIDPVGDEEKELIEVAISRPAPLTA